MARPRIVGILNVTPDSFSDGAVHADVALATQAAGRMVAQGADMIDVGGESTRPGALPVPDEVQIKRVIPVIQALRLAGIRIPLSIDTRSAIVAAAALDAGADVINDVSAGRDDAAMFKLAAQRGVVMVLMHMQGEPGTMQLAPRYGDVVAEVRRFLVERAEAAEAAGVRRDRIVIDPGIGFGKTTQHNVALLRGLRELVATGYAVMLGASRKRFLGEIAGIAQARDRDAATAATTTIGVMAGVKMFRVHDVASNRQAADVAAAVVSGGSVSG
jgi:dihydropteroate synthase